MAKFPLEIRACYITFGIKVAEEIYEKQTRNILWRLMAYICYTSIIIIIIIIIIISFMQGIYTHIPETNYYYYYYYYY